MTGTKTLLKFCATVAFICGVVLSSHDTEGYTSQVTSDGIFNMATNPTTDAAFLPTDHKESSSRQETLVSTNSIPGFQSSTVESKDISETELTDSTSSTNLQTTMDSHAKTVKSTIDNQPRITVDDTTSHSPLPFASSKSDSLSTTLRMVTSSHLSASTTSILNQEKGISSKAPSSSTSTHTGIANETNTVKQLDVSEVTDQTTDPFMLPKYSAVSSVSKATSLRTVTKPTVSVPQQPSMVVTKSDVSSPHSDDPVTEDSSPLFVQSTYLTTASPTPKTASVTPKTDQSFASRLHVTTAEIQQSVNVSQMPGDLNFPQNEKMEWHFYVIIGSLVFIIIILTIATITLTVFLIRNRSRLRDEINSPESPRVATSDARQSTTSTLYTVRKDSPFIQRAYQPKSTRRFIRFSKFKNKSPKSEPQDPDKRCQETAS